MIESINDAVVLKIIITVFLSGITAMNFKILWDWLTAPKANKTSIEKAHEELVNARLTIVEMNAHLESLSENLNKLSEKLDNISKIITGDGNTPSITFRLVQVEKYIERLKTAN